MTAAKWPAFLAVVLVLLLVGCMSPAPPKLNQSEAYVWGEPYKTFVIQIDFIAGREPSKLALDAMEAAIRDVTDKQVIRLLEPRVMPGSPDASRRWSHADVESLHARVFRSASHSYVIDGAAFLHVMYLDGALASNEEVVGYAQGAEIVMFADVIRRDSAIDHPAEDRVERSVLVHEVGHALGLVGCGIPMVRAHQEGGCHSTNEKSVMHAYADVGFVTALLDRADEGSSIQYRFDEDDLRDLAAFRESGRRK